MLKKTRKGFCVILKLIKVRINNENQDKPKWF
jgi:hypothetical protein